MINFGNMIKTRSSCISITFNISSEHWITDENTIQIYSTHAAGRSKMHPMQQSW